MEPSSPADRTPRVLLQFAGNRRNDPTHGDQRPGLRFARHPGFSPVEHVYVLWTDGDAASKAHATSLAEAIGHERRGGMKVTPLAMSAGTPPKATHRRDVDPAIAAFVAELAAQTMGRRFSEMEFVVWTGVGTPAQWTSLIDALDARGARIAVAWDSADDAMSVWRCPPEARGIEPVVQRLEKAPAVWNVLITGPTGAGKSAMAQRLHDAWRDGHPGRKGELIPVNAAGLPHELLESELFGHARGAFTGASSEHLGAFKRADGGTLFLDEIGDLPLGLQARLLTALDLNPQTHLRTFSPLGSSRVSHANVRLIFGTNQDLGAMAHQKSFRVDLLGRISTHHLRLPALKLARHRILGAYVRHLESLGALYVPRGEAGARFSFSIEARRRLTTFIFSEASGWVWNHRDVMQSAERLALGAWVDTSRRSHEVTVSSAHVEAEITELTARWRAIGDESEAGGDGWAAVRGRLHEGAWEKLSQVERWELRYLLEARAASTSNAGAWRWIAANNLLAGASDPTSLTNPSNAFAKRWNRFQPHLRPQR